MDDDDEEDVTPHDHVRFAPSPTGLLHVGNARAALANYLFARHQRRALHPAHRRHRSGTLKDEYAEAIARDLRWLGLDWDDSFRQRDRLEQLRGGGGTAEAVGPAVSRASSPRRSCAPSASSG